MDALDAVEPDAPAAAPGGDERADRNRRRIAAAGAGLAVAGATIAIAMLSSGSASPHTTGAGVPPGDTTAVVARRTLSESSTVDGTLGYGSPFEIYDRLGGTFTWLPAVGSVVTNGQALFRINNEPVVLMYGSLPAYRTLQEGVGDGPDVSELNDSLIALGYDPYGAISERDHFGEATAAAVKRWQKAEGLAQTGSVALGRIVFAPGARRVTAVKVALGQDPPGDSEAPAATTPAATTPAASTTPAPTAPASTTPASTTPASKPPTKPEAHEHPAPKAPSKPHAEAPSKPAKKASDTGEQPAAKSSETGNTPSSNGSEGSAGGGELVLSTTSTQQIVQLKVKAEQQQLAHVGERAPVLLPGGTSVPGRITSVGSVATSASSEGEHGNGQSSDEGSESATIAVTLVLERRVPHLDEAPVSVELVKSVRRGALTVPATALTATAGGGYVVQTIQDGRRVSVGVTPGMFAQGYVQVEGAGVRPGLTVLVPQ